MNYDEKFAQYIFKKGKVYRPAALPADIPRGRVKACFDTCVSTALRGKYRYVEGLARDPRHPELWILHAWLTDGIHAFDPTWKAIDPAGQTREIRTHYVGIEMEIRDVGRFMVETKYCGVFANAFRAFDLAKECAPGLPVDRCSSLFHIEIES